MGTPKPLFGEGKKGEAGGGPGGGAAALGKMGGPV